MEHRWGTRISIDAPVRWYSAAGAERDGRLCNLSLSGAFIRVDVDLRILTPLAVRIGPALSPLDAYVTRLTREGVGVEWCEFAPPTVARLLKAISSSDCVLLRPRPWLVPEPRERPGQERLLRAG